MSAFSLLDESRSTERVLAFLRERGAERTAHPGGSLFEHLVRTARRLDDWGASAALVSAGLCHATYGTGGFSEALLGVDHRSDLIALIGPQAEALVYAYASYDRDFGAVAGIDAALVRDRFTGVCFVPSENIWRQVLELTCANEIDILTCCGPDGARYAPAIVELLVTCRPLVSPAARGCIQAVLSAHGRLFEDSVTLSDCDVAYREVGNTGPTLLLLHGGANPELTWKTQMPLARDFRLKIPWRRGFGTSMWTDRQDWASDARDVLRVAPDGAHIVAHSYGAVGAAVAAGHAPHRFASLTLIEPPIWSVAENDASVRSLADLARAFSGGDARARKSFLQLAALDPDDPRTIELERRALDHRDPGEARPRFDAIVASRLPVLIVSGAHNDAMEIVCDALAKVAGAERWSLKEAGHAVQHTPEFNKRLTSFLSASQAASR